MNTGERITITTESGKTLHATIDTIERVPPTYGPGCPVVYKDNGGNIWYGTYLDGGCVEDGESTICDAQIIGIQPPPDDYNRALAEGHKWEVLWSNGWRDYFPDEPCLHVGPTSTGEVVYVGRIPSAESF